MMGMMVMMVMIKMGKDHPEGVFDLLTYRLTYLRTGWWLQTLQQKFWVRGGKGRPSFLLIHVVSVWRFQI